ncbi:MAG: hypothetical protein D6767_05375, partial [Candidatus Hydrogenedentota bacterium]
MNNKFWQKLLEERKYQADIRNAYIRLLVVAIGAIYVVYLEKKIWIFYGTYILLVVLALPFWGIFLPKKEKLLQAYRYLTAILDSVAVTLTLYSLTTYRGKDFLLYTPLFSYYFIILMFNSFRMSPAVVLVNGITSMIGFWFILSFTNATSAISFPENSVYYLALLSPWQQQVKLALLAFATILMYALGKFYLNELYISLDLTSEKEELNKDLSLARKIQRSLFPTYMENTHAKIITYYEPAQSVGGDCFEIIRMRENKIGLFIADVSGHGVSSALISTSIKITLQQMSVSLKQDPQELLSALEDYISKTFPGHHLSAQYAFIDAEKNTVQLASAGHPLPIIIKKKGIPYYWPVYGSILGYGLYKETKQEFPYRYEKGDRLFFYTDGIVEARNPQGGIYTYERLIDNVKRNMHLPLKKMRDAIIAEVLEFTEKTTFQDDTA